MLALYHNSSQSAPQPNVKRPSASSFDNAVSNSLAAFSSSDAEQTSEFSPIQSDMGK